jgi:hypothetical protein
LLPHPGMLLTTLITTLLVGASSLVMWLALGAE